MGCQVGLPSIAMKLTYISCALAFASFLGSALAGASYTLSEKIVGERFFTTFNFEAIADPTGGRVVYVNQSTAQSLNLSYATKDIFVMRADPHPSGIPNPDGIAAWPSGIQNCRVAIWEINEENWPKGGEADIVEGVNNVVPNQSTLHTSPGCSIPASTNQSGTTLATDCDSNIDYNAGCGVMYSKASSYGPLFNELGGGWYAMERTNSYISVWFWSRLDISVPFDVTTGAPTINTSNWGTPAAYFPNTHCDFATHFGPNNVIINLTFCGAKAGNETLYSGAGCPSDCVTYVDKNPTAFTTAYFEFSSMSIYL